MDLIKNNGVGKFRPRILKRNITMSESDDLFKKMLDIDELPEKLTERYRKLSIITDRMSETISIADMANMALNCGYDPDTKQFIFSGICP